MLKLENMKTVIEGARKELDEWWDKCFCSQEQRQEFAAYRTGWDCVYLLFTFCFSQNIYIHLATMCQLCATRVLCSLYFL